MKANHKLFATALTLAALTAGAWAQTATATKPAAKKKHAAAVPAQPAVTAANVQSLKDAIAAQQLENDVHDAIVEAQRLAASDPARSVECLQKALARVQAQRAGPRDERACAASVHRTTGRPGLCVANPAVFQLSVPPRRDGAR